jgi:hypothetical protein
MVKVSYNGGQVQVSFDAEWAAGKSQKDFVAHEKHHGLTNAQLIEAHNLCKTAVAVPAMEATREPVTDES